MEVIKDKFILDSPLSHFSRNNYFSPLEPKYKAKPRISYYAKYLLGSNELKSSSISPVNIKNYKDHSFSVQAKCPKSCLYLKSMQIDVDKIREDSPQGFRGTEVRSLQSPVKSPVRRLRIDRQSEKAKNEKIETKEKQVKNEKNCRKELKDIKEKTYVKAKLDHKVAKDKFFKEPYDFRWFDIRDSLNFKDQKCPSHLNQFPRSFKRVREMIRTKGLVNCGENTDEESLVGWTVDRASEYLTEESRLNIIN